MYGYYFTHSHANNMPDVKDEWLSSIRSDGGKSLSKSTIDAEGYLFRLVDGDGEWYLRGIYYGDDDASDLEPADTYGDLYGCFIMQELKGESWVDIN